MNENANMHAGIRFAWPDLDFKLEHSNIYRQSPVKSPDIKTL